MLRQLTPAERKLQVKSFSYLVNNSEPEYDPVAPSDSNFAAGGELSFVY
jgi:hypothetical protein